MAEDEGVGRSGERNGAVREVPYEHSNRHYLGTTTVGDKTGVQLYDEGRHVQKSCALSVGIGVATDGGQVEMMVQLRGYGCRPRYD